MYSLLRQRLITVNRPVLSSWFHLSVNVSSKKKSSLKDLIENISNKETNQNLDNLVKNVQDQNQKKQQRKQYAIKKAQMKKEKMNDFDSSTKEVGQKFWFPQTEKTKSEKSKKQAKKPAKKEMKSETMEGSPDIGVDTESELDIGVLREKIKSDHNNREVSRLMSAMIDRIDQGADDVEVNFQKLVKSFSNTDQRRKGKQNLRNQDSSKTTQRRTPPKLSFNNPTSLFTNLSIDTQEIARPNYFESNWNKDLNNLLPEMKPLNAFDAKMLNIDREWNFPIDNEQDIGIEEETGFDEHVFLDHLLDEEFPEEGPVYKFIELVITGLQQNPHLTVEEKTNQVLWFKEYFDKFPEDDLKISNLEF